MIESSPNCPEESEDTYLPLVKFLMNRISPDNLMIKKDRPFSWLAMHLGSNDRTFEMINNWML
jgi:hypothetical protein